MAHALEIALQSADPDDGYPNVLRGFLVIA